MTYTHTINFGGYAETIILNPSEYDALEINGVRSERGADGIDYCGVDEESPQFYSVYAHHRYGGVDCIGDFEEYTAAAAYAREVANRYGWPIFR